jgi:glycosyltransferase involved in cell wall biosynthesis
VEFTVPDPQDRKTRVLYVVREFPQLSQTYVKAEIEALGDGYELAILSMKPANRMYENHHPFSALETVDQAVEFGQEFKPDVIHGHYLFGIEMVAEIARRLDVPYTIRSHSFDMIPLLPRGGIEQRVRELLNRPDPLGRTRIRIQKQLGFVDQEQCLGILGFPFQRPALEAEGIRPEKIVDCFPVVAVDRFRNREPNGGGIMNTGVATPKKRMDRFIDLAASMPDRKFTLYPVGYHDKTLADYNEKKGSPVTFSGLLEPEDMPPEYKKQQWLVYTADFKFPTVGWPMAVAEAQASGVGVVMANIRPDLREYVGEGSGFLYDTLDDARRIISQPVPQEVREAGFEQAEKSNVRKHIHKLTDLWDQTRADRREPVAAASAG